MFRRLLMSVQFSLVTTIHTKYPIIPQKINLGWSDPFSVRNFCLSLRRSYQLISTKMTIPRREVIRKPKKKSSLLHRQALRTKLF